MPAGSRQLHRPTRLRSPDKCRTSSDRPWPIQGCMWPPCLPALRRSRGEVARDSRGRGKNRLAWIRHALFDWVWRPRCCARPGDVELRGRGHVLKSGVLARGTHPSFPPAADQRLIITLVWNSQGNDCARVLNDTSAILESLRKRGVSRMSEACREHLTLRGNFNRGFVLRRLSEIRLNPST